ncbi:MAG TPA: two-component regulator propeller domain-containing protein, partial [Parafilimonas sp.]|nr:two-component regulator propeller domain-containing protein [Parafilimonas sp.]
MWFATKDGLNQYDGYHFKIYRHDAEDSTSLADNYVETIMEDSKGRLWVGTSSGYLDIFHHESGTFEHIQFTTGKQGEQKQGTVYQITEDTRKNIWVLCSNGLFIIRLDNHDKNATYSVKQLPVPSSSIDMSLVVSKNGAVYFADGLKPQVYILDQRSNQWFPLPAVNRFLTANSHNEPPMIYNLLEDTETNKLYAFSNIGIIRFDKPSVPQLISSEPMGFSYRQFFLDRNRNVWFLGNNKIGILNIDSRQTRYLAPMDEQDTIKLGMTHSMFMDLSGMIWVGTKGYGLMTLDTRAQLFHHKDNASVAMIVETDDGRLGVNDGMASFQIIDPSTGDCIDTIPVTEGKIYFESFNEFSHPLLRGSKQLLWFADEKRLACYNKITKQHIFYPLPVAQKSGNYQLVSDLKEDPAGNIWVSTTDGLLCFLTSNYSWKIYKNDPNNKTSLSFNAIFSLCFDPVNPKKYLWIGTNGGGINCMDIATGKCIRYSVKDGLPNNVIYGILPDDDGNLWMSTNKGLSCFNPVKRTFKNYEEKDGLQSNEFNHNAYC